MAVSTVSGATPRSPVARLVAFAVAVLLAVGAGAALGAAVGPIDPAEPASHQPRPTTTTPHGEHPGMSR